MSPDTGVPPKMAQLYPMFATNVVVEQMQSNDEYKKEILPDLLKEFKKNPNQKAPWATDCNTWQTAASCKCLDHLTYSELATHL